MEILENFDFKSASVIGIAYGGGLGDCLYKYAAMDQVSALVKPLRKRHPHLRFRAVVYSVSHSSKEIFENSPHFEECSFHTWTCGFASVPAEQSGGAPYLDAGDGKEGVKVIKVSDELKQEAERLDWPLSHSDGTILKEISAKPFCAVHLYAGDPERTWATILKPAGCDKLIEIIAAAGYNVVLLGATSKRQEDDNIRILEEPYRYKNGVKTPCGKQAVYNLCGTASVRLQAACVEHATATIGTMSAWTTLGIAYRKPAWIATIEKIHAHFKNPKMGVFPIAGEYATLMMLERSTAAQQLESVAAFMKTLPVVAVPAPLSPKPVVKK